MRSMETQQGWRKTADGPITLQPDTAEHLRAAFGQMDLLLKAQRVDAGLQRLVALLRHLSVVRDNLEN